MYLIETIPLRHICTHTCTYTCTHTHICMHTCTHSHKIQNPSLSLSSTCQEKPMQGRSPFSTKLNNMVCSHYLSPTLNCQLCSRTTKVLFYQVGSSRLCTRQGICPFGVEGQDTVDYNVTIKWY